MKKSLVIFMLFLLSFITTGCRRTVVENSDTSTSNQTVEQPQIPTFNSIDAQGVIKTNTTLFNDLNLSKGTELLAGEKVWIIGENDNLYICIYKDIKGYINKDAVVFDEDEKAENQANGNGQQVVIKEVEKIEKKVEVYNYPSAPSGNYTATTYTAAAPPTTLYTTKQQNVTSVSNPIINSINAQRKEMGLLPLAQDKALMDKAEYYCDLFASRKSIYQISGYSVQASGKNKGKDKLNSLGGMVVKNIEGFDSKSITKVGVAVIESDNYYYYCILAS